MGNHDECLVELVCKPPQELDEAFACGLVERPSRLISKNDVRPRHQRPSHRHALLLAARKLRRCVREAFLQAQHLHNVVEPVLVHRTLGHPQR